MTRTRLWLLAIVSGGLILDLAIQARRAIGDLADSDFVAFVTGARLLHSGHLYSIAAQQTTAYAVAGKGTDVVFISPPAVATLFTPFASMNPHVAFAVYTALSLLALSIAAWCIAARWLPTLTGTQRVLLVVATVASAGAAYGVAIGQLDPILFCAVVAGITLARRYPLVGGILIGTLALKPQLFVLVPVALLVGRHWRVLIGAGISVAAVAGSVLAMGVGHLLDWPRYMGGFGARHIDGSISVPQLVARITGMGSLSTVASLVLFGVGAVWLWRHRERLNTVPAALAFGLLFTVLASPHLFAYDTVFLSVPLLWLAQRNWSAALSLTLLLSATAYADAFLGVSLVEPLLLLAIAVVVTGTAMPLRIHALFVKPSVITT